MREKINRISGWGWVGIGVLSIAFSIILTNFLLFLLENYTIDPWKNASQASVQNAISVFSNGTPLNDTFWDQRISALLGILIYLVIGPGLFILCGISGEDDSSDNRYSTSFVGFVAGMVIIFAGIFTFGLQSVMHTYSFQKSTLSASKSAMTDHLRYNLASLAIESYQYLVLPEKHSGGGGSFEGLQITELPSYGELEHGTYSFTETESDTLLQISGSALPDHPDASDKVQLSVQVRPGEIFKWKTN